MSDPKIAALLRSIDLEEQELLRERNPIADIVEQRAAIAQELRESQQGLEDKLAQGARRIRDTSLAQGALGDLAEWERFAKRLEREIAEVVPKRNEAEKSLTVARERLEALDEDIVRVRLERKRVEKLLENRQAQERIQSQAIDEASSDDLSVYKNRK